MKKTKYVLFAFVCILSGICCVKAAAFNVGASTTSMIVGNTVKVTVTVSGNEVGAWTYCLSYDSSKLTFLNSTANGGGTCVNDGVVDLVSRTTTFSFKAKASGTSTVSLSSAVAYDYNTEQPLNASKGSVNITARTQAEIEASYSTNAFLKAIRVDEFELSPAFKRDVYEYNVEVENEVEKVNVIAAKEDAAAHILGDGEVVLTEGINKVTIVVTAEKGNKLEYVVNITRKELDPINVSYDGKSYTVVRKADVLEAPNYYSATMAVVDNIEVPAFKSDITGYTLVGLKDDNGNIKLYRYDFTNGEFSNYVQFNQEGFTFIPEEIPGLIAGYNLQKEIFINDEKVMAYYKNGANPNFVIIYGMNAATGAKEWYQYDLEEKTFQRFQSKEIIKLQEDLKGYYLLVIVFAIGLGLSILLIFVLIIFNSKNRKKVKLLTMMSNGEVVEKNFVVEEIKEDDSNVEEIVEENCEEDEEKELQKEEIIEEKPKKKKKTKKVLEQKEEQVQQLDDTVFDDIKKIEEDILEEVVKEEKTPEESLEENINVEETNVDTLEKPYMSKRELNRLAKQKQKDLEELQNEEIPKTRSGRKRSTK